MSSMLNTMKEAEDAGTGPKLSAAVAEGKTSG